MKSWHFWLFAWCTVGLISLQWITTWRTQWDWFHYSGAIELKDFLLSGRSINTNNSQSVVITSLWWLSIPSVYSRWTSSLDGPFPAFLLYVHSHWRCSHWKVTDFLLETTIWLRIYVVAFLYQDTQAWLQTEGLIFHCNASHIQQRCCQSRGFDFKSLSFQKTYK